VQLRIAGGPAPAAAVRHLASFRDIVADSAAAPQTPGLLRPVSRQRTRPLFRFGPRADVAELFDAHITQIGKARQLIDLEAQYLRDGRLANALADRARDDPGLILIAMIPAAPDDVAFKEETGLEARFGEFRQVRTVRRLIRAFGPRLLVGSAAQRKRRPGQGRDSLNDAPLIYIHSKVSIFDAQTAIVSSVNLNGRSMR